MGLSVVGAGWGRTGTTSLKSALEILGNGPCYHWSSVAEEHVSLWSSITTGGAPQWDAIFDGFGSAIDWPASHYWRELAAHYPQAKLILTYRDPKDWFESATSTIYSMISRDIETFDGSKLGWSPANAQELVRVTRRVVVEAALGAPYEDRPDKDEALVARRFLEHLETVKAELPPERLLVFQVKEGWKPLCSFLEMPVPDEDFPHVNARRGFRKRNAM